MDITVGNQLIMFLSSGVLLLLIQFLITLKIERLFLAPSFWFFVALFFHGYVDVWLRCGNDVHFNVASLGVGCPIYINC